MATLDVHKEWKSLQPLKDEDHKVRRYELPEEGTMMAAEPEIKINTKGNKQ